MRAFPRHWDWRRVAEVHVTLYMAGVASLFWVWPATLDDPIYSMWLDIMPARGWAGIMMAVCSLHAMALWLNGRHAVSNYIRIFACLTHLGLASSFAFMFAASGAIWGTWTYSWLVGVPVFMAVASAIEKAARWKSS